MSLEMPRLIEDARTAIQEGQRRAEEQTQIDNLCSNLRADCELLLNQQGTRTFNTRLKRFFILAITYPTILIPLFTHGLERSSPVDAFDSKRLRRKIDGTGIPVQVTLKASQAIPEKANYITISLQGKEDYLQLSRYGREVYGSIVSQGERWGKGVTLEEVEAYHEVVEFLKQPNS